MTAARASATQLAYVRLTTADPGGWQALGAAVGFEAWPAADEGVDFRLDGRSSRLSLRPGREDALTQLGWEAEGPDEWDLLLAQLREQGANPKVAPGLADERGVENLAVFTDPNDIDCEVFWGPRNVVRRPFASPHGVRFTTGEQGFGHVTYLVPDFDRTRRFYMEALGMRLSDVATIGDIRFGFLRANSRHHSLAIAAGDSPVPVLRHIMVEVSTLDELGAVRDRCLDAGIEITRDLGRHPSDGVVSVYLRTPGRFDLEVGWGTDLVDEDTWHRQRHLRASRPWGHRPPQAKIRGAGK